MTSKEKQKMEEETLDKEKANEEASESAEQEAKAAEEKAEEKQPIQIQSYHLDGNNHVNNGQYIKMAMSEIEEDIIPTGLRTDFRIQAKLGDVIYPVVYKSENRWVIALNNSEGKPYSVTEIRGQIC